ncbi:hypothetical protein HDU93_005876 [Gonapodya sp. JEL0774]|nr:hypothetical protein HDU93_005876 [Gonapodya sp. JEL0774]
MLQGLEQSNSCKVKLAILNCDVNEGPIAAKWGQNDDIYSKYFKDVGHRFFPSWDISLENYQTCPDGTLPTPEQLATIDALLLTGSRHDVWEDHPWMPPLFEFIRKYSPLKPFVGICFGHQAINKALGGQVGPMGYSENGLHRVALSEDGRSVLGTSKEFIDLHFLHGAHVATAAPSLRVLGSSQLCSVQSTFLPNRVLTLQAHPEFSEEMSYAYVKFVGEVLHKDESANLAGMLEEGKDTFRHVDRFWMGAKLLSFAATGQIITDSELQALHNLQ